MAEYTTYITCPFCGDENEDSWEVGKNVFEGDLEIQECSICGGKFKTKRHVEVTYSTYKISDNKGDE